MGNRLSSTDISGLISYNANNELIGHTTVQYQYDANGNTTQKTATGQTTTYDYNSRNRLSRVHLPDGHLVSYRYDPFGRRISKTVAGVTTCYTYSDEGLAAEYDANGTWQKSYGWKPDSLWGTDPVYQRTATGLYYHNDHLGTPQRLSDESGTIAWSAGYTAFGNATIDPILSSIDNNLRFPGQYFDQETGLHYNYQRFYDPGTGRYTQVDPIGFWAGDVNLYRYVQNQPTNWVDSSGLDGSYPDAKMVGVSGFGGIIAGVAGGAEVLINTESGEVSFYVNGGFEAGITTFGAQVKAGGVWNLDKNTDYNGPFLSTNGSIGPIAGSVFGSSDALMSKNIVPGSYGTSLGLGASLFPYFSASVSSTIYKEVFTIPYLGYLMDPVGTVMNLDWFENGDTPVHPWEWSFDKFKDWFNRFSNTNNDKYN